VLSAHLGLLEARVREMIIKSNLPEEKKRLLLILNARGLWQKRGVEEIPVRGENGERETIPVEEEDFRLLRHLFRRAGKENPSPRVGRIAMHLDGKVVRLEERREKGTRNKGRGWRARRGEGATRFPLWLHLATLNLGQRVAIPLEITPHGEAVPGKWTGFFQIGEDEKGNLYVRRVKGLSPRPYTPKTERLALDVGLSPLIATDRGDLL